jgi:hypothetical protein
MDATPTTAKTMRNYILRVEAGVRYWEDATVNGVQDIDGTLIPFRDGDLWKPRIDIETGAVLDWPQGTTADVHYKVCDAGQYWLGALKWQGDYVPDAFLCVGDSGYGDYIILNIGADGKIEGWKTPAIEEDEWK